MKTVTRLTILAAVLFMAAAPVLAVPRLDTSGPRVSSAASSPAEHAPLDLSPLWLLPAIGAIRIKDTGSLAKKFVARAGTAAVDYTEGVKAAGADWESNTRASGENYAQGVQQAIADGRFVKGVTDAGQGKYVGRASTLGAQRFPTGVQAAEGDWARGSAPYLDALKGMELPPRRPKGDPGNQARANAVAQRLRAIKVGK